MESIWRFAIRARGAWRPQGSPLLYHVFSSFLYSSGDPCGRHAQLAVAMLN